MMKKVIVVVYHLYFDIVTFVQSLDSSHAFSGSFLRFPGDITASQLARYPAARTYTLLVKYVSCAQGARNIFSLSPVVFREKL